MFKVLGKQVVGVEAKRIPKSEQKKGFFYTHFSIAHIFGRHEIGPCLHSKKAGTIVSTKPIIINKFKNVTISKEEALQLEREYYRSQQQIVSA